MVLPYPQWAGILANSLAMGLEPSPRTGAEALLLRSAHDGICQSLGRRACSCQRACTLGAANTAGSVWSCPMGTSFLYGRLSRFSFHPPTGWDAALPRRSCALSSRAQTGARWLPSGLVCRSHWPLPRLSFARTVSRKQRHDQTTTGECGVLAAL